MSTALSTGRTGAAPSASESAATMSHKEPLPPPETAATKRRDGRERERRTRRRAERERERRRKAASRARARAPHRSGEPSGARAPQPQSGEPSVSESAATRRTERSGSAAAKRPRSVPRIFMFKYTLFLLRKNCRSGGFYAAAPVKTAKNCAVYTKTLAVIWSKHSNYKNV